MATLKETIIPAVPDMRLAMHVFAPALKYRIRNPESLLPNVCIRWSSEGFQGMRLYEKAEIMGPSTLETLNAPLSGTSGKAQVILLTDSPVKVWSYLEDPPMIDTVSSDNIIVVLKEVIAKYDMTKQEQNRRLLNDRLDYINRQRKRKRPVKADPGI